MKIIKNYRKATTLDEFAAQYGLEMAVNERSPELVKNGAKPFWASFIGLEIKEDYCLISRCGNGNTPDEAIVDYCDQISNRPLVYKAYTQQRCDINPVTIEPFWTEE